MTTNLYAEYVLAILDPTKGKPVVASTQWKAGLAGALVVDAVLTGSMRLTGKSEAGVKAGRLVLTGSPSGPAVVVEALRRADGHTPKDAVARIGGAQSWKDRGGDLFDEVADELVRDRILVAEHQKILGLVPTTRWMCLETETRAGILRRVKVALTSDGDPDPRDASLASLLFASDALPHLFPEVDKRTVKRQGKALAESGWGSEAVTKAIAEVNSAVTAGVVTATMAATVATTS